MSLWRLAAGAAALTAVLSSSGDAVVLAALIGVAALDPTVGAVGALAAATVWLRIGTTSLAALAGAQAVLGPALVTGTALGAVSSLSAGLALLAAALGRRGRGHLSRTARAANVVVSIDLAAMAVAVAAGPGPRGLVPVLLRAGATDGAATVVLAVPWAWPAAGSGGRWTRAASVLLGLTAVGLAAAAAPSPVRWPPHGVLAAATTLTGLLRALAGAAVVVIGASALERWLEARRLEARRVEAALFPSSEP